MKYNYQHKVSSADKEILILGISNSPDTNLFLIMKTNCDMKKND